MSRLECRCSEWRSNIEKADLPKQLLLQTQTDNRYRATSFKHCPWCGQPLLKAKGSEIPTPYRSKSRHELFVTTASGRQVVGVVHRLSSGPFYLLDCSDEADYDEYQKALVKLARLFVRGLPLVAEMSQLRTKRSREIAEGRERRKQEYEKRGVQLA